jgi:hypothetical protein
MTPPSRALYGRAVPADDERDPAVADPIDRRDEIEDALRSDEKAHEQDRQAPEKCICTTAARPETRTPMNFAKPVNSVSSSLSSLLSLYSHV